jgi:hypothetical protein
MTWKTSLAEMGISMHVEPERSLFSYGGIGFQGRKISRCCSLERIKQRIAEREVPDEELPFQVGRQRNNHSTKGRQRQTGGSMRDSKMLQVEPRHGGNRKLGVISWRDSSYVYCSTGVAGPRTVPRTLLRGHIFRTPGPRIISAKSSCAARVTTRDTNKYPFRLEEGSLLTGNRSLAYEIKIKGKNVS